MAKINKHKVEGSTLIETLVAMVIICLVFGFSLTFFNNLSYSSNLKSYHNMLELRREIIHSKNNQEKSVSKFLKNELVFRDSLCVIESIFMQRDSIKKNSLIKVKSINK